MSANSLQVAGALALAAILGGTPLHARAGAIAPGLSRELAARAPGDEVDVIVQLVERVDPARFAVRDRRTRDGRLERALREASARNLPPVLAELRAIGARGMRELWIAGAVAATVPAGEVPRLALLPGVQQVRLDAVVEAPTSPAGSSAPAEWNLDAIGAPALWGAGLTGEGAVVAGLDTGVDAAHPDLQGSWRGGSNSWFDPYGQHATPADVSGHGTQTMGIVVGGAAGGSAIGVAPGARWIAARIYDDAGRGTLSGIHQAFQWILDPDGNPETMDAPDVVTAAWTLAAAPGTCDLEFQPDLTALEAAGIGVLLAAGNDGPAGGTSDSPANNPGAFSAGAVDASATVAAFSSRGPSACDGSIFPTLVAPGVDVRTSDLSFGGFASYAYVSGTSFAAPHLAGALALLAAAAPAASLAELRSALVQGSVDLAPTGADDASGHGALDVSAALGHLGLPAGSPPTITSSPVTTATAGALYLYQAQATDPDGTAIGWSLDAAPADLAVGASTGLVTWTPGAGQEGSNAVTVRATDASGLWATQSFTIQVAAANQPPVATADAYAASSGVTLSVAAPGVLANDSDPDGDPVGAVLASSPAHGVLALAADGSFTYTASAAYAGTDAFAYAPSDGQLLGAAVTVTITVQAPNQPPVAANDTASAPIRKKAAYTPVVIKVLSNDRDPDGSLVPGSVRIVTAPSKGGTAAASSNGTVSYTPKLNFKGTETFTYDVRDDQGAVSNAATVTVTVK
jgi:serine protease AprX